MATYVLVPGYWLGAWAWDEVAGRLRAAGHRVHAVTLTGLAERAAQDIRAAAEVDLDTHIDDLVSLIEGEDLRDVVLVAHSGAAMPVTGAADRIPERLARVVYVDTAPLPSGMAQQDFLDPEERAETERRVAEEGGGVMMPPPPFDPAADPAGLAGLSPERLAELRERATPQPYRTATQPLLRPDRLPDTPKTMIATSIPLPLVKELAAGGNPVFAAMTGPEWSHLELPTGHWPMLSRPADLADLLADLA
ncbi:alpha/beta hydrolase [Thermomonospora cellulosilytica]|uniref:Pimeloyl-ACP methyl ester carboxylesterase n=1 Tax=Thermomonospora cellulosilytica TaxID=1411118 RepID=A0A7W3RAB8_9ACTN|nr:alpha/beta fold hydrolase [Thermomonospora cellulosilytica]MBA9005686.1 pimeloyl-ACP methyl ester carboxylesterase [Thermomonospora cellulosilytica]